MRVAAVDREPWVVVDGQQPPRGAEVALVEEFARDLGVGIDWRRMSAFEALEGLEQGDLDLAIGGFGQDSVARFPGAAPTYAYFHETLTVGARPGAPVPEDLDGRPVFVPPDMPASELVRSKGGVPTGADRDQTALTVLPQWRLQQAGLVPTGIVLRRSAHVMAVPQGENAWLMRLERFLRGTAGTMEERLQGQGR
jgi:ABC-type amino acid transport substrate-binding protein